MNMNINLVEAASNIASAQVSKLMGGDELDLDNNLNHYNEEGQELFNDLYEKAWEMLENCANKPYQEQALRTASCGYSAIEERLKGPQMINMLHSAIGLATEAAEALDMLKKHIYYGKKLDIPNFKEEIGDSQWYAAIGAEACGTTLQEIQNTNIAKLKARYPEKFTEEKAENRNLTVERQILEK